MRTYGPEIISKSTYIPSFEHMLTGSKQSHRFCPDIPKIRYSSLTDTEL